MRETGAKWCSGVDEWPSARSRDKTSKVSLAYAADTLMATQHDTRTTVHVQLALRAILCHFLY